MTETGSDVELSILERTASLVTVGSFGELLTTDNLIALLVFSILFGIAINMSKEKGETARRVLDSFHEIIMNVLDTRSGKHFPNARSVAPHKLCNSY